MQHMCMYMVSVDAFWKVVDAASYASCLYESNSLTVNYTYMGFSKGSHTYS